MGRRTVAAAGTPVPEVDAEPESLLGDALGIMRLDLGHLRRTAEIEELKSTQGFKLSSYVNALRGVVKEQREADEEDLDDLSEEALLEKIRKLRPDAFGGKR